MVTHCAAAGPANFALPAVGAHGGRGEKKKQQAFPIEHNTGLPFSMAFFFYLAQADNQYLLHEEYFSNWPSNTFWPFENLVQKNPTHVKTQQNDHHQVFSLKHLHTLDD